MMPTNKFKPYSRMPVTLWTFNYGSWLTSTLFFLYFIFMLVIRTLEKSLSIVGWVFLYTQGFPSILIIILLGVQIGNCVGAGNHKHFILFLISAIVSTIYVSIMAVYSVLHMWPPLLVHELGRLNGSGSRFGWSLSKEVVHAVLRSTTLLSIRGFILIYLFISSFSVQIGLIVLLCQQLWYIYEGKTYLSHLSSQGDDGEKDCQNLLRFFGCPSVSFSRHLPIFRSSRKRHEKWTKFM